MALPTVTRERAASRAAASPAGDARVPRMERLLVAYDGSGAADRALELGARLVRTGGGHLDVIRVCDPGGSGGDGRAELLAARALLRSRGVDASFLLRNGDIAVAIAHAVREGAYDTVILGRQRRHGSAFAGTTAISEHLITHTSATVIVTH
jgi:nucleotide-binding universal stress UspA family protein